MINLDYTARCIVESLEHSGFDDITDSSGYYAINEFGNDLDRCVDVYKSLWDNKPHYVVYCSFEDEAFNYYYTEDLSVEQLASVLKELAAIPEAKEEA